ncbi:MAG: GGDEF domain-containing protein, partial [Gammaproteobacteria bacterium]
MNKNNNVIIINTALEAPEASQSHHLEICNALQPAIKFNELIQIFSNIIKSSIPHSGVIYTNVEFNLNILKGIQSLKSCSFSLTIDGIDLGELTFMRQTPFGETEKSGLSTLLRYLVYPLKNA